jgi:NADP-dependent 3-hydroxy acid dehydrogenase YdfG
VPRLHSRVVAITGASAGIGRATAERLAQEGAALVLSARRADQLATVAAGIQASGGRALAVPGDVSRESDMRALVARSVEEFGGLDVMICNAGIGFHDSLARTPPDVMRRLIDVNVMGTFYAAQAALEVFLRQKRGHIIAVSSIAGRRGLAGSSIYSATKAAQIGFIEGLRAEFAGTNLHASVVFPVSTVTDFHEAIRRDYGRTVHPKGPRQSADQVARAITECVVRPRAEVYPYAMGRWLAMLSVAMPSIADRVVTRWGRRAVE